MAMRFYQHNLGDWAAHTMHLPWIELAAYHKLIEVYYMSEMPLPGDYVAIYRLLHVMTKNEREAVRNVLAEFFTLETDGRWHQKRCDAEIARQRKMSEQQRDNISKRWNGKPSPNLSRHVDFGSVSKMPKMPVVDPRLGDITQNSQEHSRALASNGKPYDGNTARNTAVIPTMNHEPLIQKKHTEQSAERAAAAAEVCVSVGLNVEAGNSRLLALIADGAMPGDFAEAALIARQAGKGWAYAAGIVANRLTDPPKQAQERPKSGPESPYKMLPRAGDPWT